MESTTTSDAKPEYDYLFKFLLVGNANVGKSNILLQYSENMFNEMYIATIGVDFRIKTTSLDQKVIKLQLWDTAGQERYRTITSAYYKEAVGILVVYDTTNQESFNSVEKWIQEIEAYGKKNALIALVGNKVDLKEKREVTYEEGEELANKLNAMFFEVSAKSSESITACLEGMVRQIVINPNSPSRPQETIKYKQKEEPIKSEKQKEYQYPQDSNSIPAEKKNPTTTSVPKADKTTTSVPKVDNNFVFKVLLLGDAAIGKSYLLQRYTENTFDEKYLSTIGVDFKIKTLDVEHKAIKLQIWDTAGQERYRTITSSYYKGSNAIVVLYDITNRDTFNSVGKWMEEIKYFGCENILKVIVGNKCDLKGMRKVTYDEGRELANKYGISFYETSAKDGTNTEKVFQDIVSSLL